jgi:SAM-dependent methyltransferase
MSLSIKISLHCIDISAEMLEIAQKRLSLISKNDLLDIAFTVCDELAIDSDQATYHVVICQFSYMFVDDKIDVFRETHRVMKPGASLLFNVWCAIDKNPLMQCADKIFSKYFPETHYDYFRRGLSMSKASEVTDQLFTAGFSQVDHEEVVIFCQWDSPSIAAKAIILGSPLAPILHSHGLDAEMIMAEITAEYATNYAKSDGTLVIPMTAFVFKAIA